MKKLLTFLTLLVLAYGVGWAAETVYYTLNGTSTGGTSAYDSGSLTQNSITWTVQGNTTMNPWRIGGKSLSGVDRKIYSETAMGSAISKVSLEVGAASSITVNSLKLEVASNSTFATIIDTVTKTFAANTTIDFTPTSGTEWATGAYYRFTFNVTVSGGSNKFVEFKSATFYKNEGTTPVVTTYDVTLNQSTGGTISASPASAAEGTTVTVTGNPTSDAYYMSAVTVTPEGGTAFAATIDSSDPKKATFTMPAANVTVSATFTAKPTHNITVTTPSNGTLDTSPSGSTWVGNTVTVTATPNTGYALDEITVNGNPITGNTFTMPDQDVTVAATFVKSTNAMIVFGDNGSDATTDVTASSLLDYTTTGASYVSSYSDISKVYKATTGIKFSSGSVNGTLTINLSAAAQQPISKIIVNAKKYGSDVASLSVNGTSTGTLDSDYADYEITCDGSTLTSIELEATKRLYVKSITLVFAAQKAYTISVASGITNGTVEVSPTSSDGNENITVTATPDTGYELASLTFNGGTAVTTGWTTTNGVSTYTYALTTGDLEVGATFNKVQYSITNQAKLNGVDDSNWTGGSNANFSGVSTVDGVWGAQVGDQVTFNANTNNGYQILQENISIKDADDNDVSFTFGSGNLVTFTMPASNVTITSNFTNYRPTLKLAGRYNGNTSWRTAAADCATFTYDSSTDKYTIDAYFTGEGEGNYFFLLADGAEKHPTSDGNWVVTNTTGTATALTWSGSSNFSIDNGVYTIELKGDLTEIAFTKKSYSLVFSPADGSSVETGSTASVSSALSSDIAAIKAVDSNAAGDVTVGVNDDNGSTWNVSYEFVTADATAGSKTLYGKAYIGNISVTGSASYTVTKADNSKKYQLITSETDLVAGKKYIIVSTGSYNSSGSTYTFTKAAGASSGNLITDVDVTIASNIVDLTGITGVTEFTLGGSTDAWTFAFGDGTYLYSNEAKKAWANSAATPTEISFSGDNATIYMGSGIGNLQYNPNNGNGRFAAYTSDQKPVMLFKQVATGEHEITYVYDSDKLNVFGVSDANKGDQVTVTTSGKTVEGTNYACSGITVTTSDSNNSPLTVTAGSNGTYTFSVPNNLAADATITVTASYTASYPLTYVSQYYDKDGNLNVSDSQKGGTVTGPSAAVEGDQINVTVTPYSDYQLKTLTYSYDNGVTQNNITSQLSFGMPHNPTTVTATFELVPHTFTVNEVGGTGTVTGLPANAVAGTSVTFTVTPPSGCTVSGLTVTHTGGTVNVTDSGNGSYTFNMPGADVTININYFASDFYNLLTNVSDINAGDTYLIVTQANDNVMSKTVSSGSLGVVASNYDDQECIITSTADMAIVNFVPGTGDNAGKWAIHIAGGYLGNGTGSSNGLTVSDTPTYATITVNNGVAELALAVEGTHNLLRQNGSLFKFYASNSGATQPRIYKLASTVSAPVIAGSVDATIGTGKFIGLDEITISSATSGASIYYTTDGTEPSASNGTLYSGAFSLTGETPAALGDRITVKAVAISGGESSAVRSQTFECVRPTWQTKTVDGETVEAPFGDNWDGTATTFNNPMFLYPKRATNVKQAYGEENIYYYYSTDGTTPVISEATKCRSNSSGAYVFANVNMDLRAIIVVNGVASEPRGNEITFEPAAPTISLPTGTYAGEQRVSLSTTTKQQQNNVKWTTHIFYNVEAGATAFDQSTMLAADGTLTAAATAAGWKLYDTSKSPYIDIPSPSTTTLHAVTATNFYGDTRYTGSALTLNGAWQVAEATATYTVTAADLDVVFSPAGGTYLYTKKVTLLPQNVYGGTEDANFAMTYTLTWAHTDSKHVNKTNETYHLGDTITIDQDATLSVYAIDGRPDTGYGNGEYSGEHTYKIGVQQPMFSPLPSSYNTDDPTDEAWITYYVEDGSEYKCLAEIFTVSPDAQIYYTSSYSASGLPTEPGVPDKSSTRYTGEIELQEGFTTFKAIAYVGSMVSEVRTVTYQVVYETDTNNEYWYCVKEMNEDDSGETKTFRNPIEVVYMSTHQISGNKPEFAFVRDNSGYGLVYFGGNSVAAYNSYTKFNPGDWLPGNSVKGTTSVWASSYINELGSSAGAIAEWPSTALANRVIVPEYTTIKDINAAWTGGKDFNGNTTAAYRACVDSSKDMFGHYVHLRRNTIHEVHKQSTSSDKLIGQIIGELGSMSCYYDGFYLYSGYTGYLTPSDYTNQIQTKTPTYNQDFFSDIQDRGGTFAIYGIVQFYGGNAKTEDYGYSPYEIFPIAFDWIFPPIFHLSGDTGKIDMTNDTPERTVYEPKTLTLDCETRGAQIWYKTSDMEDFKVYEGETISINKTTVIEAYSTHSTQHFDELISVHRTLTVNMGEVKQPKISPESVVKAIGWSTTVTITCESSDATIWYTTDGSDPSDESNEARHKYDDPFPVTSTCTVNAIAEKDGYNSAAAEPKTYTFVKSNGIEYNLVTEASQLNESNIYVIVNKEAHMAIQRTQKDNNRDGAGVAFVNDETKTQVLGNDDLAVFTIHNNGDGTWTLHTSNGSDNKSIGYIYGAVSGTTNQLKTDFTKAQDDSKYRANITIGANDSNVDKAYAATIQFNGASDGFRQLRFNKQFGLFNTYLNTSTTGQEVFLYYKEAFPLANIEVNGKLNTDYTIADELIGVKAIGKRLWAKDQGNVSIIKTENTGGWIDYVAELEGRQTDWDQSNWVCLDFTNVTYMPDGETLVTNDHVKALEGKLIPPATVQGTYVDDENYRIKMADGSILVNADNYEPVVYTPNVLCGANFNTDYLNQGENGVKEKFWFLNPKVQEVVTIKYVVWDSKNNQFIVPNKSADGKVNGNGFEGAFGVSFGYNTGVTDVDDLLYSGGNMFKFEAIVTRKGYDYGANTSGAGGNGSGNGSGAPRRAGTASGSITVMPLNLSATGSVITEVKDLPETVKEVKAVRYIDVIGRVSSKPFEGVNIVVTEYTDGTTSTRKVLK